MYNCTNHTKIVVSWHAKKVIIILLFLCEKIYKAVTHCFICLKSHIWVSCNFFCSSWSGMSWSSVAEGKCHHMTLWTSLDNLTMLVTVTTAIMANVGHLLSNTGTGRKIKMTWKYHDFWFFLLSIGKYHFNSCHFKAEMQKLQSICQEQSCKKDTHNYLTDNNFIKC